MRNGKKNICIPYSKGLFFLIWKKILQMNVGKMNDSVINADKEHDKEVYRKIQMVKDKRIKGKFNIIYNERNEN